MGKYDFADYSTLDKNRRFLWWFDEYLRHDCIWTKFKDVDTVLLVERYGFVNYPFAELYSDYLHNLLRDTDILYNSSSMGLFYNQANLQVDLSDLEDVGGIVITYYTPSERNTMINRSGLRQKFSKFSFYRLVKHYRIILESTIINLLNVAKYSVVVSGSNQDIVDSVKGKIAPEFLYDNIDDWQNNLGDREDIYENRTLVFDLFLTNGSSMEVRPNIYDDTELGITVLIYPQRIIVKTKNYLDQPIEIEYFDVDAKYPSRDTYTLTDYDAIYSSRLIRAKPQPNLLDGLLYSRIDSSLVDVNFGVDLATVFDTDLIYLLRFNPVVTFREFVSGNVINAGPDLSLYRFIVKEKRVILYNAFYFNSHKNFLDLNIDDFLVELQELINLHGGNMENPLGYELMIQEIHACLGAGEFAYYDNNGTLTPYQMHIARNIDYLMKTFGLYYNPDGTLMSITTDVAIPPPNNP